MSAPLPILLTGIAGVAGYNAFHYLRDRYPGQVFALRRVDNWPLAGENVLPCDGLDRQGLEALFDQYQFAAVLNCEGSCALKACQLNPVMARRINVESLDTLIDAMDGRCRFVHLSIDLVYSGTRGGNHVESDATDPVTVYGETMVEAERLIIDRRRDATILRISLPMGISFNGHAGAIDWIQSRFKKRKPATLYFDEIRTPTYTDCLNRTIEEVLSRTMPGIFHTGGTRRLSLYQIAQIVNRIGGYNPDNVMGCLRREAGPIPPRAGDVTMNSAKLARVLGHEPFDPWPYYDEHVPTHADWHRERSADERGSPELLARVLYQNPVAPTVLPPAWDGQRPTSRTEFPVRR